MIEVGPPHFVHATAIVVGETGVLIEGASGSGKSSLAAAMLMLAAGVGLFARLVGDDRLGLVAANGRLLARPHPAVAGMIERRGSGLLGIAHEPACVVHMAVRLAAGREALSARLPATPPSLVLCGITLPLLVLSSSAIAIDNAARVTEALATGGPGSLKPFQLSC